MKKFLYWEEAFEEINLQAKSIGTGVTKPRGEKK
jgi:hypothetical protein